MVFGVPIALQRSLLVLTVFVSASCASTRRFVPPYAALSPRTPTAVDAPFDSTWSAVISYFAQNSIAIRTIEKASGIIVAEMASASLPTRMVVLDSLGRTQMLRRGVVLTKPVYADCGSYATGVKDARPLAITQASFNVFVTPSSGGSALRVTMRFLSEYPEKEGLFRMVRVECVSTGRYESEMEKIIETVTKVGK